MTELSTADFEAWEFRCKCPICVQEVAHKCDPDAVAKLQLIRTEYGKPLTLNSAYRCEYHPIEARKPKAGTHNQGVAFDLRVPWGRDRGRLVALAIAHGAKGIGFAETFLHIDFREGELTTWGYK